ncbi:MAG: hypothetical protein JJU05_16350 [Verrucomicrobia bacterium]|nr:hypothetical protein [Verrucomicrobiota bacterium]MCH8529129.1 hypothetical protein [Kiritimatiellia bacterium]
MKMLWLDVKKLAVFSALICFPAFVMGSWTRVGEAQAGGDAKEFGASGRADTVRILCKEGFVVINTLVVREGSERESFRVTRRLTAGESVEISLGSLRNVTGLRISDSGRGRYEVQMRGGSEPAAPRSGGFKRVAELTAGGDAKEVAVNERVRTVRIQCVSGTVTVNTVVVRDGAARRSIPVTRRLSDGEHVDLELGSGENVSGLRISDGGGGRYQVLIR